MTDFDAIRRTNPLAGVVASAGVKLIRAGHRDLKGCCPFHEERTPSFYVYEAQWHCYGCGLHGDVVDFIARLHGCSMQDALSILGSDNYRIDERRKAPAPTTKREQQSRTPEARGIWEASLPIQGTVAETYLRGRGLHLPLPDSLRFAMLRYSVSGPQYPVMVASVVDVRGDLTGILRTFLAPGGDGKAKLEKPRLGLGRIAGGAIRLAPPAAALIVTEGVEDALALQQEIGMVAWAAGGASMLPSMLFPPEVKHINIGADGDHAGHVAANKAHSRFLMRGVPTVAIHYPPPGAKDFNEAVQQEGQRHARG